MSLSLYNSMSRSLEPFVPLKSGEVGFYGCGPTVYNYAHIGNLRAYLTHDLLVRTLRRNGYDVNYVMNITDVGHLSGDDDSGEDKMVRSAEERGKTVLEIARYYTEAFFHDIDRLNIVHADTVCPATEHIDDMIALIKRIEAAGYAYRAGGNLYFDVQKFPDYGKLAGIKLDELKAGARIEVDKNKKHPADFVLWFTQSKFSEQALTWESPWGRGYPGWHVECSAMSIKYLGEQFDIHAGGIDHIPVHHTNEIAQSEAATGKPWVSYWVHNEFLVMDKGKMSKSSGNFLTLDSLVEAGYDPLDYRYLLLGAHYRSQVLFSFEALDSARNSRKNLLDRIKNLLLGKENMDTLIVAYREGEKNWSPEATAHLERFDTALKEDLSSPRALAEAWLLLRNAKIKAEERLALILEMDSILGLDLQKALDHEESPEMLELIEARIAERNEAKKARDWEKADAIRAELEKEGIELRDGPEGTVWQRK